MGQSARNSVTWTLSANGRVYGPYSFAQMLTYVTEGRLAPHSLVARRGDQQYHRASEDPELVVLFQSQASHPQTAQPQPPQPQVSQPQPSQPTVSQPQFAQQQFAQPQIQQIPRPALETPRPPADVSRPMQDVSRPAPVFFTAENDTAVQNFGRHEEEARSTLAHYVIVADMKSRSITGLEEEIFKLGPAYAILPQAWLLSSEMSINAIRNNLVQRLGKLDMLFIVDASRNKAAWFNYGPEADSRIRRIWQKAQELADRAD